MAIVKKFICSVDYNLVYSVISYKMFSFCELFTVCCGLDIGGFETEIEYLITAPFYGIYQMLEIWKEKGTIKWGNNQIFDLGFKSTNIQTTTNSK